MNGDYFKTPEGEIAEAPREEIKKISHLFASDLIPQNRANWQETRLFLDEICEILLDYVHKETDPNNKVLDFRQPEELQRLLDLDIPQEPKELGDILKSCRRVLDECVRTGHPRYLNQLSSGIDLISLVGEWLTGTCNTNMFTYEIAPVFILMERVVARRMMDLIGWPPDQGDHIFTPGGTMATLYAMDVARFNAFPKCRQSGMASLPRICVFTSEEGHFSVQKVADALGIGVDNCIRVGVDGRGRMCPKALEQKIEEAKKDGLFPFFVNATAGTTEFGAFDPIEPISRICRRHSIWLHVDAAWGGGLLLSDQHRHKLAGIELADSVTWNAHKLMGATLQCSVCFIRKEGLLFKANEMETLGLTDYLFMKDKPYDTKWDTGDKAIQCGRHNDVFKLWLMWRSKGMQGYAEQVDHMMGLARYFTQQVRQTEGFQLVLDEPEFLNICFWYIPTWMRQLEGEHREKQLDKVAPKVKGMMMERGLAMISFKPGQRDTPAFFRLAISNPGVKESDLDFLLREIAKLGEQMGREAENGERK